MEARCTKVKIKPNLLDKTLAWFKILNERKEEVLETLKQEGILLENVFLDEEGDNFYLIYYVKSPDLCNAFDIFKNSKLPIDDYYKEQWSLYCEKSKTLKPLLDVQNRAKH